MIRRAVSASLVACALGCEPTAIDDAGVASDAVIDDADLDPDPLVTGEELALLMAMSLDGFAVPPDPTNAFADDPRAARLGQQLFFDPGLSGPLLDGDNDGSEHALGTAGEPGRVSCAGCHVPSSGFVDSRSLGGQISLGSAWVLRRTPSLLGVAHRRWMMWDGRADSLFSQAVGPLESWNEMNSSRLFVAEQIHARYRGVYEAIFGADVLAPLSDTARFPPLSPDETGCTIRPGGERTCRGVPGDGAEYDGMAPDDQALVTRVVSDVGKALGAYQRLLHCGPGRFDRWLAGESDALTREEIRGAALFVGRAGCVSCHDGPRLTDQSFHNVGLAPATVAVVFIDIDDRGAALGLEQLLASPLNSEGDFADGTDGRLRELSELPRAALEGAFLTPSLRCIAGQPSFMHTGQLTELADVVDFFADGGHPGGYLGRSELAELDLTDRERADLVAFIGALEGPGPDAALLVP